MNPNPIPNPYADWDGFKAYVRIHKDRLKRDIGNLRSKLSVLILEMAEYTDFSRSIGSLCRTFRRDYEFQTNASEHFTTAELSTSGFFKIVGGQVPIAGATLTCNIRGVPRTFHVVNRYKVDTYDAFIVRESLDGIPTDFPIRFMWSTREIPTDPFVRDLMNVAEVMIRQMEATYKAATDAVDAGEYSTPGQYFAAVDVHPTWTFNPCRMNPQRCASAAAAAEGARRFGAAAAAAAPSSGSYGDVPRAPAAAAAESAPPSSSGSYADVPRATASRTEGYGRQSRDSSWASEELPGIRKAASAAAAAAAAAPPQAPPAASASAAAAAAAPPQAPSAAAAAPSQENVTGKRGTETAADETGRRGSALEQQLNRRQFCRDVARMADGKRTLRSIDVNLVTKLRSDPKYEGFVGDNGILTTKAASQCHPDKTSSWPDDEKEAAACASRIIQSLRSLAKYDMTIPDEAKARRAELDTTPKC